MGKLPWFTENQPGTMRISCAKTIGTLSLSFGNHRIPMPQVWVSYNMNVILNSLNIVPVAPHPQPVRSRSELDLFAQARTCDIRRKLWRALVQFWFQRAKWHWTCLQPSLGLSFPIFKILETRMGWGRGTLEVCMAFGVIRLGSNLIFLAVCPEANCLTFLSFLICKAETIIPTSRDLLTS